MVGFRESNRRRRYGSSIVGSGGGFVLLDEDDAYSINVLRWDILCEYLGMPNVSGCDCNNAALCNANVFDVENAKHTALGRPIMCCLQLQLKI